MDTLGFIFRIWCNMLLCTTRILFSSMKEPSRLISQGISNVYLKVITEKKWHRYPKLQFSKFKKFISRLVLESLMSGSRRIFKLPFSQLENERSGSKSVSGFSTCYFNFGRNYNVGTINQQMTFVTLNRF